MNTPQTYGTGRYTSKYPFIAMQVDDEFTFNRNKFKNLAYTAHKYAQRIRERTGKPFAFETKTITVSGNSTTTVTRVE